MQTQTVAEEILEQRVGRRLDIGNTFETKSGCWRVIRARGRKLTIELIGYSHKVERGDDD